MLNISNLTFGYKQHHPILDSINLSMQPGGIYGLLGPNGAGKSTLLYLIAGALTPQKGTVIYKGNDTRRRLPETLGDIFLVSEEFSLPSISFKRYVKLNAPLYPRFSHETLRRNLDLFGLSSDLHLGALSMGQKKKVFMSFALACNTSLLLMDEPTNGLDIPGKSAFRRFIAGAMTDDRTIIISTHQVRDIDRLLDHILIMDEHRIILDRPTCGIQQSLRFVTTSDKTVLDSALHSIPGIGGASAMLRNTDGDDTEINLEVLFDFAINNPQSINGIFNNETPA